MIDGSRIALTASGRTFTSASFQQGRGYPFAHLFIFLDESQ
jgi:hypothetical protein